MIINMYASNVCSPNFTKLLDIKEQIGPAAATAGGFSAYLI